ERGLLPVRDQASEKIVPGGIVFGQQLVAPIAVVADRRGMEEQGGPTVSGLHRGDERRRGFDAAGCETPLPTGGPSPGGNRLTGEVEHGVSSVQHVGP